MQRLSRRSSKRGSAVRSAALVVSGKPRYRLLERRVESALLVGIRVLRVRGAVEASLVDDRTMRRLNRRYCGKNAATNVLAFPWPKQFITLPPFGTKNGVRPLGEIYLGPDYIKRRKENLARMAVHGLLHLRGYSHRRLKERRRMERKERAVMRSVSKAECMQRISPFHSARSAAYLRT